MDTARRAARSSALAGLASAALLGASIAWAHHWDARADALVAGWGAATLAALVLSTLALRTTGPWRGSAKLGLALAIVSLLALAVAGLSAAAGADPSGMCGGG